MHHPKKLLLLIIAVAFVLLSYGCSKGNSPTEPVITASPDIPASNRNLLATYTCTLDPTSQSFTIEPASRSSEYHFPLNQQFPDILQVTNYGWLPHFWANIKLTHPFPGSGIDVFDPRVIAILPANPGVSCNYPIFNVNANNSVVLEPDGYTKLYDHLAGSISGNTNPFLSYFKNEPNRVWSSTGNTVNNLQWGLNYSGFGGPLQFMLVVDVSSNYPAPPQPVIDNAPEPVQLQMEISNGLTPTGGSATVTATLLDWQGPSEIKCKVEAPDLFTGAVELHYSQPGPNPDEYMFTGTISNDHAVPFGSYPILLAAWDINAGNHVFIESFASVEFPFNPCEFSPVEINIFPDKFLALQ